jgi:7,8-dihydro-6-hydroxymethylpterin-pyrophosphokinase
MPEYQVSIRHIITRYLNVTVSARTEEAAEKKVLAQLLKCEEDATRVAAFYQEEWEVDEEVLETDEIIEL